MSAYATNIVTGLDALLALEPDWARLVERSSLDHPFCTFDWVRTWWESFGRDRQLHVIVVRSGDEVVGIAPLMVVRGRFYGWPVRRLESIGNDHTPRFDFIATDEGVRREIWDSIYAGQRETWDVVVLKDLQADADGIAEPVLDSTRGRWRIGRWASFSSPFVPTSGRWDEYTARLSRKHRSNLRNRRHRLEQLGPVAVDVIASEHALEHALDDGLRIEPSGWKLETGTAIRCNPDVDAFYRRLALRAARSGILRLIFLTVNGTRIAFVYGLEYRRKLYALKIGYDPQYATYSPSKLLCWMVFDQAFAGDLTEYEFLGGSDPWKLEWTSRTRPHEWVFLFPDRGAGRWLHAAKFEWAPRLRRARARLRGWVSRALETRPAETARTGAPESAR